MINDTSISKICRNNNIINIEGFYKNKNGFIINPSDYERIKLEKVMVSELQMLLDKVQNKTTIRALSASSPTVRELINTRMDISDGDPASPYYNDSQQASANLFLTNLLNVMQDIQQKFVNYNSTERDKATAYLEEIVALKDRAYFLSKSDLSRLWELPDEIILLIDVADNIPEFIKTELIVNMYGIFESTETMYQQFTQIKLEVMVDSLDLLKDLIPEEDYAPFLEIDEQFRTLDSKVGLYTDEDNAKIIELSDSFIELLNEAPITLNQKIDITDRISKIYELQVEETEAVLSMIDQTAFARQEQLSVFQLIDGYMTSIFNVLAPIGLADDLKQLTVDGATLVVQAYQAIMERYYDLTSEQQQLLIETFNYLRLSGTCDRIGAMIGFFALSSSVAQDPELSVPEAQAAIEERISRIPPVSTFNNIVIMELNGLKNNGVFDQGLHKTVIYEVINTADGPIIDLKYDLFSGDSGGFIDDWYSDLTVGSTEEDLARVYYRYKAQSRAIIDEATEQGVVQQSNILFLQELKDQLFADQLLIMAGVLKSMPLPSAVASILIDKYMPKEVAFLEEIYGELYYANLGSKVGNAIIQAITGYVNSATYFNFASYVGQQPAAGITDTNVFPGSTATAQAKLAQEIVQADLYLKETLKGLEVIEEQKAIVMADTKITVEQRSNILTKLDSYTDNLRVIESYLSILKAKLSVLSVVDGPAAGTFKVNGGDTLWQDNLKALETGVVSGIAGSSLGGGMFPVQTVVQSDQQSYADMGQTYQLELQMHLTSMQQEWTVVATTLQVLHQMYLSLARSVSG